MRFGNEARVGFVVFMALALAGVGYFFLRGVGFGADQYTVRLSSPATIAAGNDVLLQGVKVGTVKEVTLDPDTQKPLISIALKSQDPPVKLLRSYRYSVQSSGIIGENYLDIRGAFDPNGELYTANDPNQIIPGTATGGIAGLTDSAALIAKDLRKTLEKVNVTIDRVNKGVLSYDNQVRLARTLESVATLSKQAGRAFGPQGVKFGFGDPESQRLVNRTLAGTAQASEEAVIVARQAQGLSRQAQVILREGAVSARNISQLSGEAGGVLRENRSQLRNLLVSFNRTANNISGLSETLAFIVREGGLKENTQIALGSLRRTTENIEAATGRLRQVAEDPQNQETLKVTLASIRTATTALGETAETIRNLVTDEQSQSQLKSAFATLTATATTLQQTTENLRVTTEGFKNIATDPQVQADLKAIPGELRGTLEATRATAERVNALLGGRRPSRSTTGTTGENAGASTSSAPSTIQNAVRSQGLDFTLRGLSRRNLSGEKYFGDVTFNTELFGGPVRAGLSDIGDDTGVTLQTGAFLGKNALLRYGLYRSKLGVGAEYRAGRFSLEGNLYDPNRRSYSVYGGVRISPRLEVLLGREKGRGVRSNAIGVRLSR
jgi:phospholipid/cholesterol/gamma-HCH transport system substrate-binding protein